MFITSFLGIVTSCNNSSTAGAIGDSARSQKPADTISLANETTGSDVSGCYLRVLKKDTMVLRLEQNGLLVSGKLSFDNFEKDASTGTVNGRINGNVIELLYSFQSEGMNSVAEHFFKIQDGKLIHAIGPIGVRGDTAYFSNRSAIEYPPQEAFNKVNCDELAAKYK
jgi:hypothetical protein